MTIMNKIVKNKKCYLSPATQAIRVSVESSICAGSDLKTIKSETHNVEVDEWDEIGNDISFD